MGPQGPPGPDGANGNDVSAIFLTIVYYIAWCIAYNVELIKNLSTHQWDLEYL